MYTHLYVSVQCYPVISPSIVFGSHLISVIVLLLILLYFINPRGEIIVFIQGATSCFVQGQEEVGTELLTLRFTDN